VSDIITVFTNGCFDILHVGHVRLLRHCRLRAFQLAQPRNLVGRVVVGLNSNASVRRLKGHVRPINSQWDREEVLRAVAFVDDVVIFDEDTPLELIERLRPDLIIKGGDYTPDAVVGWGIAPVEIFPRVKGYSTTAILEMKPL